MKNLEKYTSKDLSLKDAAKDYMKTIGESDLDARDMRRWADFCRWLFSECRFKYEILYIAAGNPYLQTFYVNANSEEEATSKLHESISSVSRIINIENFGSPDLL